MSIGYLFHYTLLLSLVLQLSSVSLLEEINNVTKTDDITIIKLTVALEAEGESYVGKLGVAWVISNRMTTWKQSAPRVIWSPFQFSAWLTQSNFISRLERISDSVLDDSEHAAKIAYDRSGVDPTNGATHYLNIEVTKQQNAGQLPMWVHKMTEVAKIGQHTFYK